MEFLLAAVSEGGLTASCVVWAIVVGLIVGFIAWLIPPTKAYALAIGAVVALLVVLSCIA